MDANLLPKTVEDGKQVGGEDSGKVRNNGLQTPGVPILPTGEVFSPTHFGICTGIVTSTNEKGLHIERNVMKDSGTSPGHLSQCEEGIESNDYLTNLAVNRTQTDAAKTSNILGTADRSQDNCSSHFLGTDPISSPNPMARLPAEVSSSRSSHCNLDELRVYQSMKVTGSAGHFEMEPPPQTVPSFFSSDPYPPIASSLSFWSGYHERIHGGDDQSTATNASDKDFFLSEAATDQFDKVESVSPVIHVPLFEDDLIAKSSQTHTNDKVINSFALTHNPLINLSFSFTF